MSNGNGGVPGKPRITSEMFGKSAPKSPSLPKRPPTMEDVRAIAQDIARKEIVSVSNALAQKVHQVIAKHISPVNQKFVELYNEVNKLIILVNTMQEHLQAKGVIEAEAFAAEIKQAAREARTAYEGAIKAMREQKLSVEVGEPEAIETPPILPSAGIDAATPEAATPPPEVDAHVDHEAREVFDPNCVKCVEKSPKPAEGASG